MERSTVGSLLRSTQALCSQLCDKETLDFGIAYYSERFAGVPETNQFREVVVPDESRITDAFTEAERWFQHQRLFCYRWALADGQPCEAIETFLTTRGFQVHPYTAMVLADWVELAPVDGVRILPARAMHAALEATYLNADTPTRPADRVLLAEAAMERLNDPQLDLFVATVDQQPAGRCALFQVGDIARVMDLHVLGPFMDRGVRQALTAHVLALAKRLSMRHVCVQIDRADTAGQHWFEQVGFVPDGDVIEFDRSPPTVRAVSP